MPDPDPLKDAIDAQSGRFEFFKQAVTLGLAGLAVAAALLTDPDRIPNSLLGRLVLFGFVLTLFVIVGVASAGLSTYANLTLTLARELKRLQSGRPMLAAPYTSTYFADNLIKYAKLVFYVGAFVLAFLVIFASVRIFATAPRDVAADLQSPASILARAIGKPAKSIHIVSIRTDGLDLLIGFRVDGDPVVYVSRLAGKDDRLIETHAELPNGASGHADAPAPVVKELASRIDAVDGRLASVFTRLNDMSADTVHSKADVTALTRSDVHPSGDRLGGYPARKGRLEHSAIQTRG